jgi:hypothetical protein
MGRGLSPLQQQILRLAWERAQAAPDGVLTTPAILQQVYGWTLDGPRPFDRSSLRQYDATHAALSRSITRLERRGLVERPGGGLVLTAAGPRQRHAQLMQHQFLQRVFPGDA